MNDEVNNPSHYNQNGIEVIDVIETYAKHDFRLANVLKYVCRAGYKGHPLQDLQKAQWYLNRVVSEMEVVEALTDESWLDREESVGYTVREVDVFFEGYECRKQEETDPAYHPATNHHEFCSSLATRIAGEDESAQKIKDEYYKFDRFEIQGYCASCDAEIAKGQPYITSHWFAEDLKFCTNQCVESLKAWQKDWTPE